MPGIDEGRIQQVITRGVNSDYVSHFVLRVVSGRAARNFLAGLASEDDAWITAADAYWPDEASGLEFAQATAINIGFTFKGLVALGLKESLLDVFREHARAFTQGAPGRASKWLGDTGANAPSYWEKAFKARSAHVLLSLYANDGDAMKLRLNEIQSLPDARVGLAGWEDPLEGAHLVPGRLKDRRVHFDFRDGISQPVIRGIPNRSEYSNHRCLRVAPGEFLLGHRNEEEIVAWSESRIGGTFEGFFDDGSFGVLRKMEQDVKGFMDEADALATQLDADASGAQPTGSYLRAKMCGRWPNGALVKPDQTAEPPDPVTNLNDFDFSEDPAGEGCPMGSHIRRLNPRNDVVVPGRKRPLMRRGIPYGPEYDPDVEDEKERGLLGLFICVSLEDQFEFLMHDWVERSPLRAGRKSETKDPVIGSQNEPGAVLRVPVKDSGDHELRGLDSHVTTKGTLYVFYPSIPAVAKIAGLPALDVDDPEP